MIKHKRWYLFTLLIFIFCIISFLLLRNNLYVIDDNIYKFILNFRSDIMTIIFKTISNLASPIILIVITLSTLLIRNKKYFKYISLNLILVTLLNQFLKIVFSRPRPFDMIINETGYSFPSGHSMASMAFYGLFAYLVYIKCKNKKLKWLYIFLIFIGIFLIGLSRIYLRVHYPSDVIAGFCLSLAYLIIFIHFILNKNKNS